MLFYDIKHMDSKKHKEYTGVGNELILENAVKIASRGIPLVVRTPVVPGYNDDVENIEKTAEFISQLGPAVKQYQLLPYFSFMRSKYEALGLEYDLPLKGPTKEKMTELKELAESYGVPAVIGAYSEIEV
jgi:pyruvate formate lyase activating enzyme